MSSIANAIGWLTVAISSDCYIVFNIRSDSFHHVETLTNLFQLRTFPWYWYTLEHTLEPSGTKIRTIMFETTIPCGIGTTGIDGVPIDEEMAEEEWAWLEKELQDSQE